jgi:hypothetical protein
MKGLFIGLILGAIATWCWFQTGGKISITETKTITNEVIKTVTETQIVEQVAYITKTNEVWKTNIVEQIVKITPVMPEPQKVVEKPKTVQSVVQPKISETNATRTIKFNGPRPAGKVSSGRGGNVRRGPSRNMDGSIKE